MQVFKSDEIWRNSMTAHCQKKTPLRPCWWGFFGALGQSGLALVAQALFHEGLAFITGELLVTSVLVAAVSYTHLTLPTSDLV